MKSVKNKIFYETRSLVKRSQMCKVTIDVSMHVWEGIENEVDDAIIIFTEESVIHQIWDEIWAENKK
jgi:hypothetical protein